MRGKITEPKLTDLFVKNVALFKKPITREPNHYDQALGMMYETIGILKDGGWLHKDDPSGLIAGEHKITIGEALDDYQRIILDCPAYPCVGYFNGHRITKPIIPQSR